MRGTLKLAAVVAGLALPTVLIAAPAQAGTPKGDGVMVRHYPCDCPVVPPNLDPISEDDRTPRFDDRGVRSAPKTCRLQVTGVEGCLDVGQSHPSSTAMWTVACPCGPVLTVTADQRPGAESWHPTGFGQVILDLRPRSSPVPSSR